MSRESQKEILAGAVLVVLAATCCLPALDGSWLVDDGNYIVDNANLRSGAGLWRIWSDPASSGQYYPLVYTTFWFEYQAWGLETRGYHLVNFLLHALNAFLVWRILRVLGVRGAWAIAAIFAVHPIHVESVAWITERKNVLSTACYMFSFLWYLKWDAGGRRSRRRYVVALLVFLAALLAKTSTATLPAAILLVAWWRLGRIGTREVLPLLPMFALGAGLGSFTVWLERTHVGAVGGVFDLSLAERVLVAGRAFWHYVGTILWPVDLVFDYGRWKLDATDPTAWAYPGAALALVVILYLGRSRWGRGPLTGVLYFAGTVFPALGFFNLFYFRYSFVADHFVYPASIGIIAVAVTGLGRLLRWRLSDPRPALVGLTATVLLVLFVGSWRQARAYVSMEELCRHILAVNEESWLGHNNLGDELMKRGDLGEARLHLEEAARLEPTRIETRLNLAILDMNTGRVTEAVARARAAVRDEPAVVSAHVVLGDAYLRAGDPQGAESAYAGALSLAPQDNRARAGMGSALARQGRHAAALPYLTDAVAAAPASVPARTNLAICLANLGRHEEALAQLEAALVLDPDNAGVRANLDLVRRRMEATGSP